METQACLLYTSIARAIKTKSGSHMRSASFVRDCGRGKIGCGCDRELEIEKPLAHWRQTQNPEAAIAYLAHDLTNKILY